MSNITAKKIAKQLRKDFPDLPAEAYEKLEIIVLNWFDLSIIVGKTEPGPEKAKAFVAQVKSSLHLSMMEN